MNNNNDKFSTAGVMGLGAWGKAITHLLAVNVDTVDCYAREMDNSKKGFLTKESYKARVMVTNFVHCLDEVELVCFTVPAQVFRSAITAVAKRVDLKDSTILICSKGIEERSFAFLSDIAFEVVGHRNIAVLSGPNFASEILLDKPAATVIACENQELGNRIMQTFANEKFRPYYSDDVYGVQICGAVKNVIAIAAGIIEALDFGHNAHAALLTRSLVEIGRLIDKKGGKQKTLMGLAGVGDLILTAGSTESRNKKFGKLIAHDQSKIPELISKNTIEGYYTTHSIYHLSKTLGIDMPIVEFVYNVLYLEKNIINSINALLTRPLSVDYSQ